MLVAEEYGWMYASGGGIIGRMYASGGGIIGRMYASGGEIRVDAC